MGRVRHALSDILVPAVSVVVLAVVGAVAVARAVVGCSDGAAGS